MQKLLSVLFIAASISTARAQVVHEVVDFNHYISEQDNDLVNHFHFPVDPASAFIAQSQTGGINGGALEPPDQMVAQNVMEYCSRYGIETGVPLSTSISFKYNEALVNPNTFHRVSIRLTTYELMHGVTFSVDHNNGLGIVANTYANSTSITLSDGHWYELRGTFLPVGGPFNDQIDVKAELFDLGTDGLATPTSPAVHETTIYEHTLANAPALQVRLAAAKWMGAEYLDNFVFHGPKAGSLCPFTSIAPDPDMEPAELSLFPTVTNDLVHVRIMDPGFGGYTVTLLDATGRLIEERMDVRGQLEIGTARLPNGIYTVVLQQQGRRLQARFVKE